MTEPGDPVAVIMSKWADLPHWEYAATYLGQDEHGHWLGITAGTEFARPGQRVLSSNYHSTLLPNTGWSIATFHGPGAGAWMALGDAALELYVDIATPPQFDGRTVRSVDLDLDVVRIDDGRVFIDDEDEFAEHQVTLGYPDEVVLAARASCDAVHAAVVAREAPYDGVAAGVWLARVAAL